MLLALAGAFLLAVGTLVDRRAAIVLRSLRQLDPRRLAQVASLVRWRLALEDERDALTAQGRMSAIVLVSLAPLGGIFFALMTPDYVAVLFDRGRWLLAVAVGLEIVGALWLARILRS